MLKTRVIPTLLSRNGSLVKGRGFQSTRVVGHVLQSARVHEMRNVDELIVLDVAATPEGRGPDLSLVRALTDGCFMPITVGGGVRSVEDVSDLLRAGADKVAINTAAVERQDLIREAAERFGSQAVVVSIDVKDERVVTRCGTETAGLDPVAWARAVSEWAGEILLCSVKQDGTMQGYDIELAKAVSEAVRIPVVISGGCSGYDDMAKVLSETEVHAVSAGALFQFTDATPLGAARYLAERGFAVRVAA